MILQLTLSLTSNMRCLKCSADVAMRCRVCLAESNPSDVILSMLPPGDGFVDVTGGGDVSTHLTRAAAKA